MSYLSNFESSIPAASKAPTAQILSHFFSQPLVSSLENHTGQPTFDALQQFPVVDSDGREGHVVGFLAWNGELKEFCVVSKESAIPSAN